jgi:hypothetical protein
MRMHGLTTMAVGLGLLGATGIANAQFFNYSVTYTDPSSTATFPGSTTITTTDPTTFFTVTPGGFITGATPPTQIGLFTLTPISTSTAAGPFTVTDTSFSTTVSIQREGNVAGTMPIGAPGVFTVTGHISGTLGPNSDTTAITSLSGLPASVVSGGETFDLSLNSIRNPGVPNTNGNSGGVTLFITTAASVPEPGVVALLAGMMVPATLVATRRLRRKA